MPSTAKNDLETLHRFMALPAEPAAVQWETGPLVAPKSGPGPDDWGIVAVLTFQADQREKILADSPAQAGRQAELPSALAFSWLPEGTAGKRGGAYVPVAGTPYEPKLFVKEPLLSGFVVPLREESKLLVYLHTR